MDTRGTRSTDLRLEYSDKENVEEAELVELVLEDETERVEAARKEARDEERGGERGGERE